MRRPLPLLLAGLAACAATKPAPEPVQDVLFVGNSLTYYNDLPRIVEAMQAASHPRRPIRVEMLASGGAKMADHLREGRLASRLAERRYDVVVLQDLGGFPMCDAAFPGCKDAVASVCEAARSVRAAKARPILFGTWQGRADAQRALSAATRDEARRCGLDVADVGAAMQRFVQRTGDVSPWTNDGHPSLAGSWIAAATLTRAIARSEAPVASPPEPFCRLRWQGAELASRQPKPPAECELPAEPVARAAVAAANAVSG
ncbi:hypothetical protein [Dokdonella sp.]|uniref:SGNH/GDSL hydrolase family protein n=1 Tax=Dokdonella sp. TaxID=2291710 RepID=UPI001B01930E|nr:hypothetical protein [Dokdonella sp.]MBO9662606.1 hypothetical protein [Dokdonella sp.]